MTPPSLPFVRQREEIKISPGHESRLDRFLVAKYPAHSRMFLQRMIKGGLIQVDQRTVTPHYKLRVGQTISVVWPREETKRPKTKKQKLPFPVLYEDETFLVINKPPYLIVHPPGRERKGDTLVDFLWPYIQNEDWPDDVRPGLVHRLDKDTSGLLVFAKTPAAHNQISKQFASRRVKKTYFAVVRGILKIKKGTLECKMSRDPHKRQRFGVTGHGRPAVTDFHVVEEYGSHASLVELHPKTGRTHQLRVQLAHFGYPILGDIVYGAALPEFSFVPRQLLHAAKIEFTHPKIGKIVKFESSLPKDVLDAIKIIRSLS